MASRKGKVERRRKKWVRSLWVSGARWEGRFPLGVAISGRREGGFGSHPPGVRSETLCRGERRGGRRCAGWYGRRLFLRSGFGCGLFCGRFLNRFLHSCLFRSCFLLFLGCHSKILLCVLVFLRRRCHQCNRKRSKYQSSSRSRSEIISRRRAPTSPSTSRAIASPNPGYRRRLATTLASLSGLKWTKARRSRL